MLQKIVNGIAIASGVVSLTVVGAVAVAYSYARMRLSKTSKVK